MPTSKTLGYLLDMDGVIYRGGQPIPTAIAFLNRLKKRDIPFLLLTNHSCLTPLQFQKKLAGMGVEVPPSGVFSSSQATALWLREQGAKTVFAIGEKGLQQALKQSGIATATKNVSHVVVGLDRRFRYDDMVTAINLIRAGVPFIGTNPDITNPIPAGQAPECGFVLHALTAATGVKPHIIGKPAKPIFLAAANVLGLPPKSLAMIGDRLDTDIIGANRAGLHSILVLTGHTTRDMLQHSKIKPSRVLESLDQIKLDEQ